MSPREALLLSDLLQEAVSSIWRAHGDGIADYLGCVDPEGMPEQEPPAPPGPAHPESEEDDDF